jgi:hypothetical protein
MAGITDEIDVEMIFARSDFINVCSRCHRIDIQSHCRWSHAGKCEQHIAGVAHRIQQAFIELGCPYRFKWAVDTLPTRPEAFG